MRDLLGKDSFDAVISIAELIEELERAGGETPTARQSPFPCLRAAADHQCLRVNSVQKTSPGTSVVLGLLGIARLQFVECA